MRTGAILVFLPGLAEITKMLEALAANPLFNDQVGGRYERQPRKKSPVDTKQPDFFSSSLF